MIRCLGCNMPHHGKGRYHEGCRPEIAPTLFDEPRPGDYRQSDPSTSRKAAAANHTARQSQRKQILARLLKEGRVSSHEVADICSGQNGTASKRLSDLAKDGLVVPCGEISDGKGGTPRRLYRLTDAGRRDAELMTQGAA